MKIQDVKSEYCMRFCEVVPTEELKEQWAAMDSKQRSNWYTASCEHVRASAREVLDDIFEDFEQDGYEDMATRCWDETTDEDVAELQAVLDKICSGSAFDVYYAEEEIDSEAE